MITKKEHYLILNIENSIQSIIKKEISLLKNGRVERNFTFHFANEISANLNINNIIIDPFCNKHKGGPKILDGGNIELDIAIHERNIDNNLVAIEIETNNNPIGDDLWKIKEMTKGTDGYNYKLGLYIVFGISNRAGEIITKNWYKKGNILPV